ncbi:MAG: aldose 1-epimerase [Meiothermus sp.]
MKPEILHSSKLRLTVLPGLGASVGGLELYREGFWLPLLRPTSLAAVAAGASPDTSSYILAPYSNRIREGRFSFRGRSYQLLPNWPDGVQTIHGEVHGRPWAVVERSEGLLVCHFNANNPRALNFPFRYTVRAVYWLGDSSLRMSLELTNTGEEAMPAGFGFHPYFVRRLGASLDPLLSFRAARVYLTNGSRIPDEPPVPLPPGFDFSTPRPLGDAAFDHVFKGWDGLLSLEWPGIGVRLQLEADPVFSHLVVFTAPDGTLALEPVSHATDGFNLMDRGWPDTGVRVLEPGESLAGEVRIKVWAEEW